MHGLVEHYTPELHSAYQGFFYSLAACLPCRTCRNNYVLKVIEAPFPCERSKVTIRKWVIGIHNGVNKDLNKPVLSQRRAAAAIKARALNSKDVRRAISFMDTNLQNRPPPEYRAGLRILKRHLGDILASVASPRASRRPGPRPRSQRGQSRTRNPR